MLRQYRDTINSGEKTIHLPPVKIDTGNAPPVWRRPYPLSLEKAEFVRKQCREWLDAGIISESNSPYAAPVVVVPKEMADGSRGFRLCGNFSALNKNIQISRFPLPRQETLLDEMKGSCFFSKLDLGGSIFRVGSTSGR